MWGQVFPVLTPVLVCVFIGWAWARIGKHYDTSMISALVMNVGAPCLIVSTLGNVELPQETLLDVCGLHLLIFILTALSAWLLIRITDRPQRVYFASLVFPNVGNMGLPLCMLAFGQTGLALALGWFMLNSVLHFSVGMTLVSGEKALRQLFTNPIIISVFLALALVFGQWRLPDVVQQSTTLIGGLTIPLMLITLGVSLARLKVTHLSDALLFSVARLGLGFVIAWGVCEVFAIDGILRGVVLIQSSMPVAVFNYLFAERYQQGPEQVAGMVVVSTVLAFLCLPILLELVM